MFFVHVIKSILHRPQNENEVLPIGVGVIRIHGAPVKVGDRHNGRLPIPGFLIFVFVSVSQVPTAAGR